MENALSIIQMILTLLCGGLAIYFKTSQKAQETLTRVQTLIANITAQAAVFIADAEAMYSDSTHAGGDKFNYCVDQLYDLVPDSVKPIVTKPMIEGIVQRTFDQIEMYSKAQLDSALSKINKEGE